MQRVKYRAIAEDLGAAIDSGALAPGAALPSQRELAERHGVSVMTVRQALASLVDSGRVVSRHGRGTFVARPGVALSLGPLTSLAEQAAAAGLRLTTSVVEHGPVGQAYRIVRVRRLDGETFALQTSVLRPGVTVDPARLGEDSLYRALSEAGFEVVSATETVRAVALDADCADLLDRRAGAPALLSVRESRTASGQVVLTDHALIPGDRASLTVERARLTPHQEDR